MPGTLQNLDSGLWSGPWTGLWTGLVTTITGFLSIKQAALGYEQPTEPLSEDAKRNVTVNPLCSAYME